MNPHRASSRIFIKVGGGGKRDACRCKGGGGARTLVVLWYLYEAQISRGVLKHAFPIPNAGTLCIILWRFTFLGLWYTLSVHVHVYNIGTCI